MKKFYVILTMFLGLVLSGITSTGSTNIPDNTQRNSSPYTVESLIKEREEFVKILRQIPNPQDKYFLFDLWIAYLGERAAVVGHVVEMRELTQAQAKTYLDRLALEHHVAARALKKLGYHEFAQHFTEMGNIRKRQYNARYYDENQENPSKRRKY
ncbi:MAG: hypothetical protein ACK5PQ_04890 [Alphaproteobacteria bacterium]